MANFFGILQNGPISEEVMLTVPLATRKLRRAKSSHDLQHQQFHWRNLSDNDTLKTEKKKRSSWDPFHTSIKADMLVGGTGSVQSWDYTKMLKSQPKRVGGKLGLQISEPREFFKHNGLGEWH